MIHPIDVTRRRFVGALGAATLGPPALLSGCLGDGNDEAAVPLTGTAGFEQRTLFFNLSHLGATPTTHWLHVASRKYALTPVADRPEVLRQARLGNAFLRAVPDASITHQVEGVGFSTTAVTLVYLASNESPATGRWEMTSMHVNIPSPTAAPTYAQLSASAGGNVLPLSNKRRAYGVAAAASARDLLDEHALIDMTSHAEALVGLHPDILSIEPNSAAMIHAAHVAVNPFTESLGELLQARGPAVPAGSTNVAGTAPWATLVPLMDDTVQPPAPYKKTDGLIAYHPDWSPEVEQATAQAIGAVHPRVRNDARLGIDVTGTDPLPDAQALGKVWGRHDGLASVDHPAGAVQAADVLCVWKSQTTEVGLAVSELKTVLKLADNRVQVTVDGVRNWFLRWLGVWVQFADSAGHLLPLAKLPADTVPKSPGPYPTRADRPDAIFVGMLPQVTAIFGIPVEAASFAADLKIPPDAQTVRVFYGGLGLAASAPDAPGGIEGLGIGMTVAVNYAIVGLFMAAGVSTLGPVVKLIINNGAGQIAGLIVAALGAGINKTSPVYALTMSFLKVLVQANAVPLIGLLSATVAVEMGEMQVIDAVPLVGQIARAFAAVVGALQLAETTVEVALSPSAYRFDLTLVHDLSVDVLRDPAHPDGFPLPPAGYALYRKVTYLFDQGRAHVQDAVDVDPQAERLSITLKAIPRGGLVDIKVGLYMRSNSAPPGQNDWCAGYGATGLVPNLADRVDPITITQTKIPIRADTVYLHTLKTQLDSGGKHVWMPTATAPPYVAPDSGQTPAIGDFRAITVRQATAGATPQKGYVGYAWKAYSKGVDDCRARSPGQLDLLANLGTDPSDNGVRAQDGYATLGCGLQAGASIAYGLLDRPDRNFYLDPTTRDVRQVSLATPTGFADPLGGLSYGRLNHASTRILLHPSGTIVSIDTAGSRIETLQLPDAPMSDADAAQQLRARIRSGPGTQPGLITRPLAAGISPEGAIVLVEGSAGAMRLQALDLGGNPLRYFKRQPEPYFLALAAPPGTQFLDLAIEFTGYLYLLSKDAQNNHRLEIYHPEQSGVAPICSTRGINAARLAVDLWRSVYTLNYEMLLLPNGDVPALTEPSVSAWVPPPPVST